MSRAQVDWVFFDCCTNYTNDYVFFNRKNQKRKYGLKTSFGPFDK